ncbi:MAG: hypothetical protein ABIN18_25765 [Pseudomonadota bacterium]
MVKETSLLDRVQRFKGCILITIRHFENVLYGKTDRFHIPTNLPAIADLLGYARSVHDRRGRRVWNMVFDNYSPGTVRWSLIIAF